MEETSIPLQFEFQLYSNKTTVWTADCSQLQTLCNFAMGTTSEKTWSGLMWNSFANIWCNFWRVNTDTVPPHWNKGQVQWKENYLYWYIPVTVQNADSPTWCRKWSSAMLGKTSVTFGDISGLLMGWMKQTTGFVHPIEGTMINRKCWWAGQNRRLVWNTPYKKPWWTNVWRLICLNVMLTLCIYEDFKKVHTHTQKKILKGK